HGNKFEQLDTILPTPNEYRTASGAPGQKYWQQRCDYDIKCEFDEPKLKLTGTETITYYNNSPDVLSYLWLQLDKNEHSNINNAGYQSSNMLPRQPTDAALNRMETPKEDNGFGDKITRLSDVTGKTLQYTINKTMMRVELPVLLKPGQKFVFNVAWNYNIPNRQVQGGRGGYEYFPEDGNDEFTMSQWYPRLCVYSDFQGWQNHQFTSRGEFALTFGNFKVQMTVPADHVVGATGECQNYQQMLTPAQFARWQKASRLGGTKEPVEIVTLDEAKAREKDKTYSEGTKYGMLGVVIHEVGHNFFPMIINSDERQWTWMDEGLNTFCEYLTEELYDNKFPVTRGPAYTIRDYMKLPKDQLEPIMTNSEDIVGFGPNAYSKPATGLNMLRETIMGRQLFDYAFKDYARRWAFKHPTPADFFRTLEDASGEDLDWFWRGWFYGIEPCDISIDSVKFLKADVDA